MASNSKGANNLVDEFEESFQVRDLFYYQDRSVRLELNL